MSEELQPSDLSRDDDSLVGACGALLEISEYDDEDAKETLQAVLEAAIFAYARFNRETPRELLARLFDMSVTDSQWRTSYLPALDQEARELVVAAQFSRSLSEWGDP